MTVRKIAVSGAAIIAAGLSTFALGTASPAGASCVSFSGIGNSAQCQSTLGNVAVAIGDGAYASAKTGYVSTALAIGPGATAVTGLLPESFVNTSLAAGKNTNAAVLAGIGNGSADIGQNTAPGSGMAITAGTFNRVVNIGEDNRGIATNIPSLNPPNSVSTPCSTPARKTSGCRRRRWQRGWCHRNRRGEQGLSSTAACRCVAAVGEWNTAAVNGDFSGANATGKHSQSSQRATAAWPERSVSRAAPSPRATTAWRLPSATSPRRLRMAAGSSPLRWATTSWRITGSTTASPK